MFKSLNFENVIFEALLCSLFFENIFFYKLSGRGILKKQFPDNS